jgi:hypothetical protein
MTAAANKNLENPDIPAYLCPQKPNFEIPELPNENHLHSAQLPHARRRVARRVRG